MIIGIEYSLPVDSMSVDFFICGKNETGEYMFILESKQWGDDFIKSSNFSNYRSDATELYPQTQVYRHMIAIKNYLDLGQKFMNVYPFVFVQNATSFGLSLLKSNKDIFTSQIPMTNDLNEFFNVVKSHNLERGNISITELYDAKYFPSQRYSASRGLEPPTSCNSTPCGLSGFFKSKRITLSKPRLVAIRYFPSLERRTAAALVAHSTPRGSVVARSTISNLPLE